MKITCTQKDLNRAVSVAIRATSPRSTMPIMTYLLLSAYDETMWVNGTSVQMRIESVATCKVSEDGMIAVPARLLAEIVGKLSGSVTLEVNNKTKTIDILCGNYRGKINGLDGGDFPKLPADGLLASSTIKAEALSRMIDLVAFAASTDQSRPNLTGVSLAVAHDRIAMAATDGYRASMQSGSLDAPVAESLVTIVPSSSLQELSAALATVGDEAVTVDIFRSRIAVSVAGLNVSMQTIVGNFPDCRAIIPKTYATVATVDSKAFTRALQVARILTKQDKDGVERVNLDAADNCLSLTVSGDEIGNSGDAIEAVVTGKPSEITLNIAYLLDVISRVEGNVELHLNGISKPCIIRLPDVPESHFVQAIMPFWRDK